MADAPADSDAPVNNFETNVGRRGPSGPQPRRRRRTDETPHGRYDGRTGNTRMPPGGLARPKLAKGTAIRKGDLTVAAIDDPYETGPVDEALRTFAVIDRRVDILEWDRSHGDLSEAAYRTGRIVQHCFELSGRVGGSNWAGGSRIDASLAKELNVLRTVCNAKTVEDLLERMRDVVGVIDARLMRRLLGDRMDIAQCAGLQGKSGDRGERYIKARYREALEELAEAWTARGKVIPTPDDAYLAAATEAPAREAAALANGATSKRRAMEAGIAACHKSVVEVVVGPAGSRGRHVRVTVTRASEAAPARLAIEAAEARWCPLGERVVLAVVAVG